MRRLIETLLGRRHPAPCIEAGRLLLRPPLHGDFAAWSRLRAVSRAFLEPWEPVWPADDLTPAAFRARVDRATQGIIDDAAYPFLIFEAMSGQLVGGLNLANIRRRAAQSGTLGYWIGQPFAGRGYMSEGVGALCRYGAMHLKLERIEAACLPANIASIRVLEKNGFLREGTARAYLEIAGRRQDHLMFSRLAQDAYAQDMQTKDMSSR